MDPIVDVNWARKHPREAARIQVAYLLRRVRNEHKAHPKATRKRRRAE